MRVGAMLRAWREKRDLSVRDAAPMIGVSIATLSRIERGEQMDAETQLKLIVFLFSPSSSDALIQEAQKKAYARLVEPQPGSCDADHRGDDRGRS